MHTTDRTYLPQHISRKATLLLKGMCALAVCFLAFSCKPNVTGVWQNERIDAAIRDSIKIQNEKVLKAFRTNDLELLKSTWSDTALHSNIEGKAAQHLELLAQAGIRDSAYKVLGEYYALGLPGGAVYIHERLTGGAYKLNYTALTKQSYVSLIVPRAEHELLALLVYGKYKSGWKLNIYYLGQYSIAGRNALDYYANAKRKHENGYFIGAAIDMLLAERCLKPGGDHFHYTDEQEIRDFKEAVMNETSEKLQLPITVTQLPSKPVILSIEPYFTKDEVMPLVNYRSTISLKDTNALKKENMELRKVIATVLPTIENDNRHIYYRVYNRNAEESGASMLYYGIMQQIKF
jgi:hypothetical protein